MPFSIYLAPGIKFYARTRNCLGYRQGTTRGWPGTPGAPGTPGMLGMLGTPVALDQYS